MPLLVTVVTGVVVFLVVRETYSSLLLLPWTAIPTLSLLALGELITAVHTRRRIRGEPGTEPVEPISAARLVALAKASILFGALALGGFGGFALALLDWLHSPHARSDALIAGGTALSGLLLIVAGAFLEYACRVPKDDQENGAEG
ncbi:DUF3180 domain-containing protein [Thermobifida halotolerans]|uniref:DUF3180 domain-containing protein n=1 Tax=Thermobifida halotolerans TaxID=483545 RepID=A0AA97M6H6_9ACTN|nr:DUF3180 domain-containing protein [Thermobifida halotolerans]